MLIIKSMENNGKQVEYNSADIRKKPKKNLITNVRQLNKSEKLRKFFSPDNTKIILAASLAVMAVIGLVIVLMLVTGPSGNEQEVVQNPDDAEITQIQNKIDSIGENISGQTSDEILSDLNARIAAAEEAGNNTQVYRLKLAKADVFIKLKLGEFALDEIINPLISENRDNDMRLYDLYSRAIVAYGQMGDEGVSMRLHYLEQIVMLPDEVFPNTTDDTWKASYQKQLAELQ